MNRMVGLGLWSIGALELRSRGCQLCTLALKKFVYHLNLFYFMY